MWFCHHWCLKYPLRCAPTVPYIHFTGYFNIKSFEFWLKLSILYFANYSLLKCIYLLMCWFCAHPVQRSGKMGENHFVPYEYIFRNLSIYRDRGHWLGKMWYLRFERAHNCSLMASHLRVACFPFLEQLVLSVYMISSKCLFYRVIQSVFLLWMYWMEFMWNYIQYIHTCIEILSFNVLYEYC